MYGEGGFGGQRRGGGGGGGFRRGPPRQGGFAPVKVGEEIDVRIEAVGEKGDGIAKKKGFILFVPNANEGDEVRIRITKVLSKVGFAEVIGEAQGPIEASDAPSRPKREEAPSVQPAEEEEPEISEDFGEEDSGSDDSEEEPADEDSGDDMEEPPEPSDEDLEEDKE